VNETRIRLLTHVVGAGIVQGEAGTELTVPEPVARQWCDGVRAERVRAVKPETATERAPERAVAVENAAARVPEHATQNTAKRATKAAKRARGR
jgi:hypothetical protein